MSLGDLFQDRGRFLRRLGIERNHHAARIAIGHRHRHFRTDAQRFSDKIVLREAVAARKVEIDVGPEAAFIDEDA